MRAARPGSPAIFVALPIPSRRGGETGPGPAPPRLASPRPRAGLSAGPRRLAGLPAFLPAGRECFCGRVIVGCRGWGGGGRKRFRAPRPALALARPLQAGWRRRCLGPAARRPRSFCVRRQHRPVTERKERPQTGKPNASLLGFGLSSPPAARTACRHRHGTPGSCQSKTVPQLGNRDPVIPPSAPH